MSELKTFVISHGLLFFCMFLLTVMILFIELIRTRRSGFYLTPAAAVQMLNHNNAVIIDVRPADVFRQGHIVGAISMLDARANPNKLEKYKGRPIIFVCENGGESQRLAALFYQENYNSYSIYGGILNWSKASLPLAKV